MAKSLLASMSITQAGKAHCCRFNKKHQFSKGDWRLTLKVDRDELHYCLLCARSFLAKDVKRITDLQADVEKLLAATSNSEAEND